MENLKVYPASKFQTARGEICLAQTPKGDRIVAPKECGFSGEIRGSNVIAPASAENAAVLRELLPFTAPCRVLNRDKTFGFGDRLGLAGSGHLRVVAGTGVSPVLAQQSMRELNLTRRTYSDVLDAATFAAFREGFTGGFGADGDHLKTAEDIGNALALGYTMITLDASEHIRSDGGLLRDPSLEAIYLGKCFELGNGLFLTYSTDELARYAYVYGDALDFAGEIWQRFFSGANPPADFEMSIDETSEPTDPKAHFFCACELLRRGVRPTTVAPRFCGDFQKGIDYIGDPAQFERELSAHAAIAGRFGYKISIHSGSDKFSVFPAVARNLDRWHVKTAGTSWLEAMRIVSRLDPGLFRASWKLALASFPEALAYYHITSDPSALPPIESVSDGELPALFSDDTARQLIHITYGQILNAPELRSRLFSLWQNHGEEYAAALGAHLGKHLELLGEKLR
ncbi:MAG: tagaturonate epimerase family protein [Clostridiales bacterium]|nr:tagaturonate epimerase family protein [Clostridiales bacterium]